MASTPHRLSKSWRSFKGRVSGPNFPNTSTAGFLDLGYNLDYLTYYVILIHLLPLTYGKFILPPELEIVK